MQHFDDAFRFTDAIQETTPRPYAGCQRLRVMPRHGQQAQAAPLGLRVPFSHEMAVTAGTLSSAANSVCVQPS